MIQQEQEQLQQEQQYQQKQCIPKCQNCFQKYEEQLCGMHKCKECEYNICEKCIIQQTPYCQMGHKFDLLILDIKNQKMMKKIKTHFCNVCSYNLVQQWQQQAN
ncbi:hypothetical protein PPERSA_10771 [Pseudocohnilembus persalinus]|uniref:Uncharacterized protein n=1 Tax=Pseudocohnilembus persalinus TaxID=266149 RepID=A0A0V0QDS3_PSEPJ|nr:hypothetical protein PPERSA_10771 [Pseudocohnilembus persalinus]|eukprot:KRX00272.1 hypothetical protein PPERSA_10771 [Pseudocohnilembus persalinus]